MEAKTKVDRLQRQYDRETNHGNDRSGQQSWNQRIAGCIAGGNSALPDPR
jgi:hypothetical protein